MNKEDFPLLKKSKIAYLDNAATTQKSKEVIDCVNKFYMKTNSNTHRGLYDLSINATAKFENTRKKVADLIKCMDKEVIFTFGTTDGMNLLANKISKITSGSEIVITEMEHHSNLIPWQILAKEKNWKLKVIPIKDDFTLDYEIAKKIITPNTAIVSCMHVSNVLGVINDVEKLYDISKKNNAIFIIDAAQSIPHIEVNSNMADFILFSSHKLGGPSGVGVLYGKEKWLDKIDPLRYGGNMVGLVDFKDSIFKEIPNKHEAGTMNIEGVIGLGQAIDYINKIGYKQIKIHEEKLKQYCIKKLSEIDGIKIFTHEKGIGIISFLVKGIHSHDIAEILGSYGVCIRAGNHCCMPLINKLNVNSLSRISFWMYNTNEDIDKLIDGIKKAKEIFKK